MTGSGHAHDQNTGVGGGTHARGASPPGHTGGRHDLYDHHRAPSRGGGSVMARAASPPWHTGGRHDHHDHHRAPSRGGGSAMARTASPPGHTGGHHDHHDRHRAPSRGGGSVLAPWHGGGRGGNPLTDNSLFKQQGAAFNHSLPDHHGHHHKLQGIGNAGFRMKLVTPRQDHASHGDRQMQDSENKSKYSVSGAFPPRQDQALPDGHLSPLSGRQSTLRKGDVSRGDHSAIFNGESKRKFSIWSQIAKKKTEKPIESLPTKALPTTLAWSHGCTEVADKTDKMKSRTIAVRPIFSRARTKIKEWEDSKAEADDQPTTQSKAQALWQVAQAVREGAKKTCRERNVTVAFLKVAADKRERVKLEEELNELGQLSDHQGDAANLPSLAALFKALLHEMSCMKLDGKVEIEMMHSIREVMHKLNALKGMYSMGSETVKGLRPQIDKMVKEVNHMLFVMKGKLLMVRRDMQAMCTKVMKELKELKRVPEDSSADVRAGETMTQRGRCDDSEEEESVDTDGLHGEGKRKTLLMRRVALISNFEKCVLHSLLEKIEDAVDDVSHAANACGDTAHSQELVREGAALEERSGLKPSRAHPGHRLHHKVHKPRSRHRQADLLQLNHHMYRFDEGQQSSESEAIDGFGMSAWAADFESMRQRYAGGAESSGRLVWARQQQQWSDHRAADTPCIDEFEADNETVDRSAGGAESSGRLKTRPKRKFQKGSDGMDSFDADDLLETKALGGSQSPKKLWAQPRDRRESLEETPSPLSGRESVFLETPVPVVQNRLESPFLWVPPSPLDKATSPPPSRRGKRKAYTTKPNKHRNCHRPDIATMTVEAVLADREERGLRSRTPRAAEGASDIDAACPSTPLQSPTVCAAWITAGGD